MSFFVMLPVLLYAFLFRITLSITVVSSQNIQYALMSDGNWSLVSCHPWMICSLRHCRWSSCDIACSSSWIVMQSCMLVVICMASVSNCMSGISASLFSLWFCLETSLLWTNLAQACIWSWLCIDVFWVPVIMLLHLLWRLLLAVCDL